MNIDPQQLQIRDIHLPPAVHWWPPAPGWWMLLGLLVMVAAALWIFKRIRRRGRLKRVALSELRRIETRHPAELDGREFAAELSALLRRVSISKADRSQCAGLVGEEWLGFLDKTLGDRRFTQGPGRALIEAPYRPDVEIDGDALLGLVRDWVKKQ